MSRAQWSLAERAFPEHVGLLDDLLQSSAETLAQKIGVPYQLAFALVVARAEDRHEEARDAITDLYIREYGPVVLRDDGIEI